jgi:hypothetical protein
VKSEVLFVYQQLLDRAMHCLQYSIIYGLVLYCDDDVCVCVRARAREYIMYVRVWYRYASLNDGDTL